MAPRTPTAAQRRVLEALAKGAVLVQISPWCVPRSEWSVRLQPRLRPEWLVRAATARRLVADGLVAELPARTWQPQWMRVYGPTSAGRATVEG